MRRRRHKKEEHETIRETIETETELLKKVIKWMFQAKATMLLILIILAVYIVSAIWFTEEMFASLIFTRESLLQLNLLPMAASWFLHANLVHLFGNLIALFIFGRVVERRLGMFGFLLTFFGAAITSDIIAGLVFGQGGIGASGAIAGLVAAAVVIDPFYITYLFFGIPLPVVLLGWLAVFLDITGLISPKPGDNAGHIAHLAGFFAITLFIYLLKYKKDEKVKKGFIINILTVILGTALYFFAPSARDFLKSLI